MLNSAEFVKCFFFSVETCCLFFNINASVSFFGEARKVLYFRGIFLFEVESGIQPFCFEPISLMKFIDFYVYEICRLPKCYPPSSFKIVPQPHNLEIMNFLNFEGWESNYKCWIHKFLLWSKEFFNASRQLVDGR